MLGSIAIVFLVIYYSWAFWLGNRLLRLWRREDPDEGGWKLIGWWVGWYIQALLVLGLGRMGWLSPAVLMGFVLAPIGFVVLDRRCFFQDIRVVGRALRSLFPRTWRLVVLIFLFVGWFSITLTVKPFFYDTLFYHYGQPVYWLAYEKIIPTGPDTNAYLPMPTRMHFLVALGVIGDEFAGLMLWANFLLLIIMTGLIAREVFRWDAPWPFVAMLMLAASPMLWEELLYRLVDGSAAVGGAMLAYLAGRLRVRERITTGDRVVFTLLSVVLLCVKPAVTAGYVLGCWLLAGAIRRKWWPRSLPAGIAVVFGAAFFGLFPWIWHAWTAAGHPLTALAPYLGRWPVYSTRWEGLKHRQFHISGVLREIQDVRRFFQAFLFPEPGLPANRAGILIVFSIPIALFQRGFREWKWLWAVGLAGVYFTFRLPRYSMVLLPVTVLIILEFFKRHMPWQRVVKIVAIVFVLDAAIFLYRPWTGLPLRYEIDRWLGQPPKSVLPSSVPVCQWVNLNLDPASARILFIGETRYYPCQRPFRYWNPMFRHPMEILHHQAPPEKQWDSVLLKGRFTHVIYTPAEARRLFEWSPRLHRRFEQWLYHRCRIRYRARDSVKETMLLSCAG